ncbi:RNA polymerase II-associated protein [Phanerochaete sordida]|uniref:RNA polymerase II-associated protein n=1 Tax=Phanerochaete sordida TaxID=48140 RepID=A0A9P3G4I7_9APHY|nr:RNA polymerase II-associated protein [Phanerochaete sordida]
MSSTDPLQALRQAIKSKSQIKYSNDSGPTESLQSATHLILSASVTLPKSTPTRLRKPGSSSTDPSTSPKDFFTLDAVYLAWLLRDASGAEYMKQARENGLAVGFVSITERKSVVDWLEGRTSDLPNLIPVPSETTTPPGSPQRGAAALPSRSHSSRHTDTHSSPTKRKYVPDLADVEVVKKIKLGEIELRDRNTVLHGVKPNNFSSVKTGFAEKLKKMKETSKGGAVSTPQTPDPKLQAKKAKNLFPIIIISSSPTSLVTMHNVKRFLQDAFFETPHDARAHAASEGNPRAEDVVPIYRKRTTIDSSGRETEIQMRYFVVDSAEALSKFGQDAWDRVVCVMTTGQAWQFKPYKWNDPKVLFHHVKGFYVSLTSDPPNPKIKDWNVTELKIDPNRRHVDKSTVAQFWKTLDAWTLANKPWIMKT